MNITLISNILILLIFFVSGIRQLQKHNSGLLNIQFLQDNKIVQMIINLALIVLPILIVYATMNLQGNKHNDDNDNNPKDNIYKEIRKYGTIALIGLVVLGMILNFDKNTILNTNNLKNISIVGALVAMLLHPVSLI